MRRIGPFDLDGLSMAEVAEQEALAARARSGQIDVGHNRELKRLDVLNARRPVQTVYLTIPKTPQEVA